MTRDAIRSILVVGDGIVGLSAALAFQRALPRVDVKLLRMPMAPAALADRCAATLPTVGRFHAAIGVDEIDLVRRDIAIHHLGTRFEGGPNGDWTHSFGEVGRGEGMVPFHQLWRAVGLEGHDPLGFDHYSPASVIGGAGKFVHPSGDPQSPLANHLYGLRFNPDRYRAMLDVLARGVERIEGPVLGIERRDDGAIARLSLVGGRAVEADLFVDCSGPAAVLIGAIGGPVDDWSASLPAKHVQLDWEPPGGPEPMNRVARNADGWLLAATVPGATMRAKVTTQPTATSVELTPGRRTEPFVGNVLAIGDSAVVLDPLHAANLSLAHSAILRAIDLLPGRNCHPLELAEYNRLTALETTRARDFQALLHLGSESSPAISETLERTIVQWRSRGRLPFFEEELFSPSSWMQMLIGNGIVPDHVAPTARSIDPALAAPAMARFADELRHLAKRLPTYSDYLDRIRQSR